MIQIEIDNIALAEIPVVTEEQARLMIQAQNEDRMQEADEALGDGDMDDFRYLTAPFFRQETDKGVFISQVQGANGKDIRYSIHARIDDRERQPEISPAIAGGKS